MWKIKLATLLRSWADKLAPNPQPPRPEDRLEIVPAHLSEYRLTGYLTWFEINYDRLGRTAEELAHRLLIQEIRGGKLDEIIPLISETREDAEGVKISASIFVKIRNV